MYSAGRRGRSSLTSAPPSGAVVFGDNGSISFPASAARTRAGVSFGGATRYVRPSRADPTAVGPAAEQASTYTQRGDDRQRLQTCTRRVSARAREREGPASHARIAGCDPAPKVEEGKFPAMRRDRLFEDRALARAERRVAPRLLERRELSEQKLTATRGQARLAQAVERERLVDAARTRSREDQAKPHVPVRRPSDRLVEATVLEEERATDGRVPENEVPLQDGAPLVGHLEAPGVVVGFTHGAASRDEERVARQDVEVGSRLRELP